MHSLKRGFTLVELLVVVAIIGLLVALLLPAVQSAREAARRAQCVSQLKQVGLAMHNYEQTFGRLPIGTYGCCWGTWQVSILPYIEQKALFDLYVMDRKFGVPVDDARYSHAANWPVTTKTIKTLTCPSDTRPQRVANNAVTYHNYVVNYGNTIYDQIDFANVKFLGAPFFEVTGVNDRRPGVRFAEITDDALYCYDLVRVHRGGIYVCMEGPQFSTLAEAHVKHGLERVHLRRHARAEELRRSFVVARDEGAQRRRPEALEPQPRAFDGITHAR